MTEAKGGIEGLPSLEGFDHLRIHYISLFILSFHTVNSLSSRGNELHYMTININVA